MRTDTNQVTQNRGEQMRVAGSRSEVGERTLGKTKSETGALRMKAFEIRRSTINAIATFSAPVNRAKNTQTKSPTLIGRFAKAKSVINPKGRCCIWQHQLPRCELCVIFNAYWWHSQERQNSRSRCRPVLEPCEQEMLLSHITSYARWIETGGFVGTIV